MLRFLSSAPPCRPSPQDASLWQGVPPAAIELVQCLLDPNEEMRISAAEAMRWPWLRSGGASPQTR